MMRRYSMFILVAVFLAAGTAVEAVQYARQDLGMLSGCTYGYAYRINARGQVIGWCTDSSGHAHASLWQNGGTQDLGTLGGSYSYASGINDAGMVVGYSSDSSGNTHAFLSWGGGMQDISALFEENSPTDNPFSYAVGINNMGQIAGWSSAENAASSPISQEGAILDLSTCAVTCSIWSSTPFPIQPGSMAVGINNGGQIVLNTAFDGALLSQNGAIRVLGTLGYPQSYAVAINDHGQVVVESGFQQEVYLWNDGVMQDLGYGRAYGINNSGQVVGNSRGHAVLWQNGTMQDLGDGIALGINDSGQIVGRAGTHAVVWTPVVPEPSSSLAILCGICAMGRVISRRKSV